MPFPGTEWWIRLGFLNQNYISEFVTEDLWGRPQPTEWKFAELVYIALSVIIDNTFLEKLPFSLFWKILACAKVKNNVFIIGTNILSLVQIYRSTWKHRARNCWRSVPAICTKTQLVVKNKGKERHPRKFCSCVVLQAELRRRKLIV